MRIYLLAFTITSAISLIAVSGCGTWHATSQSQQAPEYGSLRWHIQRAKAKGERQLQICRIVEYGSEFRNPQEALREALSYFAVIVAEPVEKKTYADEDALDSWYRFKIVETLNARPTSECPTCINPSDPPGDLLAVGEHEILVAQAGGAMVINDLYVVDNSSWPYLLGQKYLMFLRLDPAKRTGAVTLGPVGVFTIDHEGLLESVTTEPNALKKYILKHHCNSLEKLRTGIQRQLRIQ